jgi:hypothetical protein
MIPKLGRDGYGIGVPFEGGAGAGSITHLAGH